MLRIRCSKSLVFIGFFLAGAGLAGAQPTTLPSETQIQAELDTMPPAGGGFTPRVDGDSPFKISGQLQVTFYPEKNEYDPNYGVPFSKEVTARYALATDITARYRDLPVFFRMYDFLALGRTLPQMDYNYDPTPILLELQPTIGYDLNANWDVRLTYDQMVDLGNFVSHNEVIPWLALSTRVKTHEPIKIAGLAEIAGYAEGAIYMPGFEYSASPGASPAGQPVLNFSRDQIVNARYSISLEGSMRPLAPIIDHVFVYASPQFFFGDASLSDHSSFAGPPISTTYKIGIGIRLADNLDVRISKGYTERLSNGPANMTHQQWSGISVDWGF